MDFEATIKRTALVIIFTFSLAAIIPFVFSWNVQSRMASIKALVETGSPIIDESPFIKTGDKAYVNGHFYSDKLPAPAIIGALIYAPLFHFGIKLDRGWNLAYYIITLLTIKVFWLIGIIAFYSAHHYTGIEKRYRNLLSASFGFGSLYFAWSSTFNNHIIAASALMIGFLFWLRSKENPSAFSLFISGIFFALAGISDAITGVFYLGFLTMLLFSDPLRKRILFYLLPLLITIVPTFAYIYAISGSLLPPTINSSFFHYSGSPWLEPADPSIDYIDSLAGTRINDLGFAASYATLCLFGPKGFILYNPLLLLALPCLFVVIREKGVFAPEAMTVAICSTTLFLYYILYTTNFGGFSYSIRWFIPLLPFLFFFLYRYFLSYSATKDISFITLFSISLIIAIVGLFYPWSNLSVHPIPFISNLIAFRGVIINGF